MGKNEQNSCKLNLHQQSMSNLIKGIFGYKQIDFEPKGEEKPKSVRIKLRDNDLVRSFKRSKIYQRNFRIIFQYTFAPPDGTTVDFCIGKPDLKTIKKYSRQEFIHTVLMNTILFCVDEKMQEAIFESYTLPLNKYNVTTRSIFDVMANYDSINGTPVICTKEQMQGCQDKFGKQTIQDKQTETSVEQHCTVEEIFESHPELEDDYLRMIGEVLVKEMLPLFFDETISDDVFQQRYDEVLSSLSGQIKKKLIKDAEMLVVERKHMAKKVKQIILVDPAYQFDQPDMQVVYVPERSPVLSDWHIPVQRYVKYIKPEIRQEDVKAFLSYYLKDEPYPYELVHAETTEPIMEAPISDESVMYRQSMFQNFHIIYLTQEHNSHFSPSLFEYLGFQDDYISLAIEETNKIELNTYWKSVLTSVEDLLSRVFQHSEDFVTLIQEEPLPRKAYVFREEHYRKLGKNYQDYLAEYPDCKKEGLDIWLETFQQKYLLEMEENIFSDLVPQNLVYQHYALQWERLADPFRGMLGEDYLTGHDTKQLAYVCIPLIGEIVSELKENAEIIAKAAKGRMPFNKFQNHLHLIKKYLADVELDKAIQKWNETIRKARKSGINFNHSFRGLLQYAQQSGNLFQNLKDALESYCEYLEK